MTHFPNAAVLYLDGGWAGSKGVIRVMGDLPLSNYTPPPRNSQLPKFKSQTDNPLFRGLATEGKSGKGDIS